MKSSRPEHKYPQPFPPLRLWHIVAALFTCVFLVSLPAYRTYHLEAEAAYRNSYLQRFEKFSDRSDAGDKGLRVIAIGSSLMAYAIMPDQAFEELASEKLMSLKFLHLARPCAVLEDFKLFFEKVLDVRPSIILLESDSVFYHRCEKGFLKSYPDFLREAVRKSLKVKRPALPEPHINTYANIRDDVPRLQAVKKSAGRIKKSVASFNRRTLVGFDEVGTFFSEAAKRGVRVALVDVRRSPEFEALAGDYKSDRAALFERLRSEYRITMVAFPEEMASEFYADPAHMNEAGRKRFSQWLVKELKLMAES
ncbi:MAG: hypothetical protein K8I01_10625 [Candidatus Methylomirabilis sp.]|nr:hypothetical protein [Deltaproteobacteria bacterium]